MNIIKRIEDHASFWIVVLTTVLVVTPVLLWITTNNSVREARNASQGNIIMTLNRDFFFEPRMYKVRKAIEAKRPIFKKNGEEFAEQDIDDYVGFFEIMSDFIDKGILNEELVGDNFDIFIMEPYENKEIKKYIADLKKDEELKVLKNGAKKFLRNKALTQVSPSNPRKID